MRGTWQTTGGGGGEALGVLASLAVGALMVWLIITYLWLIAVIVGLALLVSGAGLWLLFRHGSDVAVVSRAELPPPYVTALPPRRAEAIQGPQQLHIHFHGVTADEQAERLASIREADHRAYDSWRDQ